MYVVMVSKTDVIVSAPNMVEDNKNVGFEVVGIRKTISGAERLAEQFCE